MLNCTVPGAITAISSTANISGTITVISAATNMRV
jgi:NAD/NADP transhydrogenase alpha subunit